MSWIFGVFGPKPKHSLTSSFLKNDDFIISNQPNTFIEINRAYVCAIPEQPHSPRWNLRKMNDWEVWGDQPWEPGLI